MMKRENFAGVMTAAVLAALLAGCGGQKSAPASSEPVKAESEKAAETTAAEKIVVDTNNKTTEESKETETAAAETTPAETTAAETTAAETSAAETKPAETTAAEEKLSSLAAFWNGDGAMVVDDGFNSDCRMIEAEYAKGESILFSDLMDRLGKTWPVEGAEPEIAMAELTVPGKEAWVLSFQYYTNTDNYTQFYLCSDENGTLKLHYAIDAWSRRYPDINKYGVVSDGGSDGAADHTVALWVPDKEMNYTKLSETREIGYGSSFYDLNYEPEEKINAVMEAAGENPGVDAGNIYYGQSRIGDRTYYYFGGYNGVTQDTVNLIDGIAAEHGFTFDGITAVREAEKARAESLGAGEIYSSSDTPEWTRVVF